MVTKTNITVSIDTEILKKFKEIAARKGLKVSTFINTKLNEFLEEEVENEKSK